MVSGQKKPLILRAVSRMAVGGVQRGILATLARADRDRFDYAVLCTKKEGKWAEDLRQMGVAVYLHKTLPPWGPFRILRLSRAIRKINPDLVHIHMAPMVIPVASACLLAGVKHFMIHHHNFYDRHWNSLNSLLYRWERGLTRRADALIGVSESVGQMTMRHLGLAAEKIFTVPNGIEIDRFRNIPPRDPRAEWGLPPETPLVLHVARYLNTKRIEDFIEAGAIISRRWRNGAPPAFVVIGGGAQDYEDLYRRKIAELGADKTILLAGSRDDVPQILPSAQVGALASENEGFGQVIQEYIAAGLPVAATNLPPIAEMVSHEQEALLSPPRRPDLLADNIERLLLDRDLARRLVEQGRQRQTQYTWENAVRGYEEIYQRILNAK